jgi:integrase
MTRLRKAAEEYLAMRRGLGFKLEKTGVLLLDFMSFMEEQHARRITNELAVRWAKLPADALPTWWATRLSAVRLFARHWSATDPRTQVPPPDLLPGRYNRRPPYFYSQSQITRLLRAAHRLEPAMRLRRWTYPTLFGLLSVTGLRISEALALDGNAVDLTRGQLTIHQTKFGKSRLVPASGTACFRAL